jgi:hypothetical protein
LSRIDRQKKIRGTVIIATLQGGVAELSQPDTLEIPDFPPDPEAGSRAEILSAFAQSLKKAKDVVASTDDDRALAEFTVTKNGKTLAAYLRELDVKMPSMYGPSRDTNPFA